MGKIRFSILVVILILITTLSCGRWVREESSAAHSLALWPHEKSDLKPDPALIFGRLDNGFRYVVMKNAKPQNRVSMKLDVQAGSIQETGAQQGLAHYLEHMTFNGSTHFKPGEMVKYLQRIGMDFGPDVNAHTGFYETVYDVLLPANDPKSLADGLRVLSDYAQGAHLLPSEVERERGIILAEKRMRDSASFRTFVSTLKFELPESLISRRLPIGIEETIQQTDQALLKDYYDTWYRPERMILIMVGDVEPETAVPLIQEWFSVFPARASARPDPDIGPIRHEGVKVFYHYEQEFGSTETTIEALERVELEPDSFVLQKKYLIQDIADTIVQNRLNVLLSKPDPPFTEASVSSGVFLRQVKYAVISAKTTPENWERSLSTLEQILRSALMYGFTGTELDRVKKDLLSEMDTAIKNAPTRESSHLAGQILSSLNSNRIFQSPEQKKTIYGPVIDSLTLAEVNQAFQDAWEPDHRLVLLTGNADIRTRGPDPEAVIRGVYAGSAQTSVQQAMELEPVNFPYLPEPKHPGSIVNKKEIPDMGIVQVDFENGLRLNLKRTDFKANQALANLVFGWGRSSEPEDRPGLSRLTESVINESGLGGLTSEELTRALSGKNTTVRFSIDQRFFSFQGSTVSDEMNLLFQLFHAYLSDPGFREDAFRLSMERYRQDYEEMNRTIEGVLPLFGHRFLAGGDTRFGLPVYDEFKSLTLSDVRGWIVPAMNQAPMELSVVGDFNVETVIELAARYLGSLPKREDSFENTRTDRPDFPEGKTLDMRVDTRIPKGIARVAYPTDDIWNIQQTRRTATLANIFSDRLREVIREKLGATYSPYAYNAPAYAYPGYGVLHTVVSIDPDQADLVIREIKSIAADLAGTGVTPDELARALNPTLSSIKDSRQDNGYWLNVVLTGSKDHPEQIEWSRTILEDYAAITTGEISALAAKYLDNRKAAVIIITPCKEAECPSARDKG
jgi:zinc protease